MTPRLSDHYVQLGVFIALFAIVSVIGLVASRWRRPEDFHSLEEWGLGGRSFGNLITWVLVGGDLYTAYTFIAVPALVYSAGAIGFFAVPFTIIVYPLAFVVLARMWSVSHVHGFVTPADFVRARFGSPTLALLVAVAGIVATMPYIALQLVGLEAVFKTMGIDGRWPVTCAFVLIAIYTYNSGLRGPALIAFVKDGLVFVTIVAAIMVLPFFQGGWGNVFRAVKKRFDATPTSADALLLSPNNHVQYVTLALGSALALFLYPHAMTGILAARSRGTVKRNMAALPVYSLLLGLIALLGFVAIGAGVTPIGADPAHGVAGDPNTIVPAMFDQIASPAFAGVVFATIGVAALVPTAIMSIAAANLFTRNVYREYLRPGATPAEEARVSRLTSLVVKFGALALLLFLSPRFSVDLQLIGGVVILQTLPAVAVGLYSRWLHRWGLVAGVVAGLAVGFGMLYQIPQMGGADGQTVVRGHFGGAAYPLSFIGFNSSKTIYVGFVAVAVNLAVAAGATIALRSVGVPDGEDQTVDADYVADEGDANVRDFSGLIDGEGLDTAPQAPVVRWTGTRPTDQARTPSSGSRW